MHFSSTSLRAASILALISVLSLLSGSALAQHGGHGGGHGGHAGGHGGHGRGHGHVSVGHSVSHRSGSHVGHSVGHLHSSHRGSRGTIHAGYRTVVRTGGLTHGARGHGGHIVTRRLPHAATSGSVHALGHDAGHLPGFGHSWPHTLHHDRDHFAHHDRHNRHGLVLLYASYYPSVYYPSYRTGYSYGWPGYSYPATYVPDPTYVPGDPGIVIVKPGGGDPASRDQPSIDAAPQAPPDSARHIPDGAAVPRPLVPSQEAPEVLPPEDDSLPTSSPADLPAVPDPGRSPFASPS